MDRNITKLNYCHRESHFNREANSDNPRKLDQNNQVFLFVITPFSGDCLMSQVRIDLGKGGRIPGFSDFM